eukprot:Hpha_TRINITY_DN16987_c0_g1::TRINITY_DN16987_c0_g1_i1::g.56334::m.56334/K17609/NXN; nucleoredoxin
MGGCGSKEDPAKQQQAAKQAAAKKEVDKWAVELLGEKLLTKHGLQNTGDVLAGKEHICIYFSAHWCPPCRAFTPHAAKVYSSAGPASNIEVIFVSSDSDQSGFDEYYSEMPWVAVPFADRARKDQLNSKFGVSGIPSMVRLDGTGNTVEKNARFEVQSAFGRHRQYGGEERPL